MLRHHRNPLVIKRQKYNLPALSLVVVALALGGLYLIFHSHAASTNADINDDGVVDIKDLSTLASHFGQNGASFAEGDITGDGTVDISDLSILASHYGQNVGTPGNPVQVSVIPAQLGNYFQDYGSYNSTIFCADQLTSAYDPNIKAYRQYFVYGGTDRQPYITTRILPSGRWQTPVNLTAVMGNQNFAPDGHNCIVAGVDPEGYIHVTGNMHAVPLLMAQSTAPNSIANFVNVPTMVDTATEDQVTYPTFFKTIDGTLMLAYRWGSPGESGKWYLNRWDTTSGNPGHWVRVVWLTEGSGESFYPWRIAVDRSNTATRGRIHYFGTWRVGTPTAQAPVPNEDLLDYYSDDNGVTWHQYGNPNPVSLPIVRGSGSTILTTTVSGPNNRYILNSGGLDIDSQGRPHALVSMSTTAGTDIPRLHHVWYDGTMWHIDPLNSLSPKPRSSVFSDTSGNTWGLISPGSSATGKILVINLTPGSAGFETQTFPLAQDLSFGNLSAIFDSTLLDEQNQLSFMLTETGGQPAGAQPDDNYKQPAYVETIPLDQVAAIGAGGIGVAIPHLQSLSTQNLSGQAVSGNDLDKLLSTTSITNAQPLYVKITATGHITLTTSIMTLKAVKTTADGDVAFGRLDFRSTTPTTASTPWIPVQIGGNYSGILSAAAQIDGGSGTGTLDSLSFQVSSFVYPSAN